jgi:hypothetical protein
MTSHRNWIQIESIELAKRKAMFISTDVNKNKKHIGVDYIAAHTL